ncbi:MAG: hypothetical protein K2R98_01620 [Gemmataceae bacterium]|nr:hypothetical protein [Gemmataceae bacterium]
MPFGTPLAASAVEFLQSFRGEMNTLFSLASAGMTAYFWLVRVNRERESVRVYQVSDFAGTLEPGQVGYWVGKIFLANRSINPTAIVEASAELYWNGRWVPGVVHTADDVDLLWNLTPLQVVARKVGAAFPLDAKTTREQVYAPQKLRVTFVTVEGKKLVHEVRAGAEIGTNAIAA